MTIYNACIVNTLLYNSEARTTYAKRDWMRNSFYMCCLCCILSFKVPNVQVFAHAGLSTMGMLLRQCRLHWLGHVHQMEDGHISKNIVYSKLTSGKRSTDHPKLREFGRCSRWLQQNVLSEKDECERRCEYSTCHHHQKLWTWCYPQVHIPWVHHQQYTFCNNPSLTSLMADNSYACIVNTLLYSSEARTTYTKRDWMMNSFHMWPCVLEGRWPYLKGHPVLHTSPWKEISWPPCHTGHKWMKSSIYVNKWS